MPASRLPDINTAWIVYRREAISSWKSGNYDAATGALYTFNALLPIEHQVKISDQLYEEKTKQDITATCNKCEEVVDFRTIKIFKVLMPMTLSIILGSDYEEIWICTKCNNENSLKNTKLVQNILQEPFHLRVVKKPPQRSGGLMDRRKYPVAFSLWFWSLINELEGEAALYRDENWNRGENQFDEEGIDTTGEENAT